MLDRLQASHLLDIADKLDAGERLTLDDGCRLFACPDLLTIGWLANRRREQLYAGRTFYNHNIRLEATNVFNYVNLVNPGTNLNAPATFGKIRSARDMRRIQLGARISF